VKRNRIPFFALLLAILLVGFYFYNHRARRVDGGDNPAEHPRLSSSSPTDEVSRNNNSNVGPVNSPTRPPGEVVPPEIAKDRIAAGYFGAVRTPISFWGKVVDESGAPIAGATAIILVNDKVLKTGSRHVLTTDVDGLFSLTGSHGIALSVSVSKDGYSPTAKARAVCGYAVHSGTDIPIPSKSEPAVLVLRKKQPVPELIVRSNTIPLSGDGTPIGIALNGPNQHSPSDTDIRVQVSISPATVSNRYNWICRISLLDGGIQRRADPFNFEAPESGYHEVEEIRMAAADARPWSPQGFGDYFVKLNNDSYARVALQIVTGGDRFITVVSYLNPTPGSRNLEFDPNKQIKPQ
jgi:Carboxypeptidase regulatory-like domain